MRITDLMDLEQDKTICRMIKDALFADVVSLAIAQFHNRKCKKFMIQIRLKEINKYR